MRKRNARPVFTVRHRDTAPSFFMMSNTLARASINTPSIIDYRLFCFILSHYAYHDFDPRGFLNISVKYIGANVTNFKIKIWKDKDKEQWITNLKNLVFKNESSSELIFKDVSIVGAENDTYLRLRLNKSVIGFIDNLKGEYIKLDFKRMNELSALPVLMSYVFFSTYVNMINHNITRSYSDILDILNISPNTRFTNFKTQVLGRINKNLKDINSFQIEVVSFRKRRGVIQSVTFKVHKTNVVQTRLSISFNEYLREEKKKLNEVQYRLDAWGYKPTASDVKRLTEFAAKYGAQELLDSIPDQVSLALFLDSDD